MLSILNTLFTTGMLYLKASDCSGYLVQALFYQIKDNKCVLYSKSKERLKIIQ